MISINHQVRFSGRPSGAKELLQCEEIQRNWSIYRLAKVTTTKKQRNLYLKKSNLIQLKYEYFFKRSINCVCAANSYTCRPLCDQVTNKISM